MTQKSLFPEQTSLPPGASDFVKWLAENAPDVKEPVEYAARQTAAFPGLDLLREAQLALAWNAAQPATLRKRAIGRFLNNWFARSFYRRRPDQSAVSLSPGNDFGGGYRRIK